MVLDPLGALGKGGQPPDCQLAAAFSRRFGGSLSSGGQSASHSPPLVLGEGLGQLILGLHELVRAGVGQDEASSQTGVEDHDEQNVDIVVVTRDAGHLVAQEGIKNDPQPHGLSGVSTQATGIAPVIQSQQQATQG